MIRKTEKLVITFYTTTAAIIGYVTEKEDFDIILE